MLLIAVIHTVADLAEVMHFLYRRFGAGRGNVNAVAPAEHMTDIEILLNRQPAAVGDFDEHMLYCVGGKRSGNGRIIELGERCRLNSFGRYAFIALVVFADIELNVADIAVSGGDDYFVGDLAEE